MWVVYSETGERVSSVPSSEKPETDLEDEWEAVIETMDHKDFVAFMAWVWSDTA